MRRGNSPNLEVVGSHEDVCQSLAHHVQDPLVKVLWRLSGTYSLLGSVNHTIDALYLHIGRQTANVVLQWVCIVSELFVSPRLQFFSADAARLGDSQGTQTFLMRTYDTLWCSYQSDFLGSAS
jgi:hypothetical protein